MNQKIRIMVIALLVIVGCIRDNNSISPASAEHAFVIDILRVNAIVQTDTLSGSPATYFYLRITYHFEGRPGSLDNLFLSTSHLTFAGIFESIAPSPTESQLSMSPSFKDPSTFLGQDSIFIYIGFSGRFWERKDTRITNYGTFSIKESLWVHPQR
jgi:hypothetical protein